LYPALLLAAAAFKKENKRRAQTELRHRKNEHAVFKDIFRAQKLNR
jgi:hypothetical protein